MKTDVVVVGAGIMGSAAAWQIARRGSRVTVLEQFDLHHLRGSSHGASRIFRVLYDEPEYVRLALQSLPLWREVERESALPVVRPYGSLALRSPAELAPLCISLEQGGATYERLSEREMAGRFPTYRLPPGWEALYQPDAGVILADTARRTFLDLAARSGAQIADQTPVTHITPLDDGVEIRASNGTWQANTVVITGAGWTNRLLAPLGLEIPMVITREQVSYFPAPTDGEVLPTMWGAVSNVFDPYALPNGDAPEFKLGEHGAGPEVDPDQEGSVDEARISALEGFVRDWLPRAHNTALRSETCIYASSRDDDFVIDRIGPVVLGFGFGGHGFKFAPLVGSMLANLVSGDAPQPLARFAHARFS